MSQQVQPESGRLFGAEDRLQRLLAANSEGERLKSALEWKKQGGRVIGVMSSYVPEEVITAAGMLPWRITGTWSDNVNKARVYRSDSSCEYCTHVLESFLSSGLDVLDGIVITDIDHDMLRLWDVISNLNRVPLAMALHVPFVDSRTNHAYFAGEIRRMIAALEGLGGTTISSDRLRAAIAVHNDMRDLLSQVYAWRKRRVPPLSGAEMLSLTTAAQVLPRDHFAGELRALLPHLDARTSALRQLQPRVLVLSEMLDNPAYLELVEEHCVVAMDDLDTGSRYVVMNVDLESDDPIEALSKRLISRHGAPRMANWEGQFDQIVAWVREYHIDGVLGLPLEWCYPARFRWPLLSRRLDAEGIPNKAFERDYHLASGGQLRTRVGAFLEQLSARPNGPVVRIEGAEHHG